ncbi:MAG: 3-dehydroquinate synthase family protein, partial [Actinomycetota bacterium]
MKSVVISAEREYSVDFVSSWRSCLIEALQGRRAILFVPVSLEREANDLPANVIRVLLPEGEKQKDPSTFITALNEIAKHGLSRSDLLVGLGGGATTDLVGFLAASYLRGIEWIGIPTSLAGMVDASIGGKTGINLDSGKNLAGAFYSPSKVIIDFRFLATLSDRDLKAGMAEVAKCGFISDTSILDLITDRWRENIEELASRSIAVKASVVSRDFKESFEREILNYGHTLGHAIEKDSSYSMRHGECVSIGLVFAAELSHRYSGLSATDVLRHREVLRILGLPTTYSANAWDSLYRLMQS